LILNNYRQFGGKHCETASLKNDLAYLGVLAPHTGKPFTEEMLLGVGGGIGVAYWLFEFEQTPFVFIGARYSEKSPGPEFLEEICSRIGARSTLAQTSSAKKGEEDLRSALDEGRPAIVWADMAALPYWALPPEAHFGGHTLVVYGLDDKSGEAFIADRASSPLKVKRDELATARGSAYKPFPPKNKLLQVEAPPGTVSLQTLQRAIIRGISDCCRRMLNPPIANFGLKGLKKWADLVADPKNKKGWPSVFKPGLPLYAGLMYIFVSIEISGTGGSAFRLMYSDFLNEASNVLNQPELKQVAALYKESAGLWSDVGVAALPDSVEPFRKTRELFARKNGLFEKQGQQALDEMLAINHQLDEIRSQIKKEFPLDSKAITELLGSLKESILRVHDKEKQATTALKDSVKG
jgi:hypothetical protein